MCNGPGLRPDFHPQGASGRHHLAAVVNHLHLRRGVAFNMMKFGDGAGRAETPTRFEVAEHTPDQV
jgi:hypothetical protein